MCAATEVRCHLRLLHERGTELTLREHRTGASYGMYNAAHIIAWRAGRKISSTFSCGTDSLAGFVLKTEKVA